MPRSNHLEFQRLATKRNINPPRIAAVNCDANIGTPAPYQKSSSLYASYLLKSIRLRTSRLIKNKIKARRKILEVPKPRIEKLLRLRTNTASVAIPTTRRKIMIGWIRFQCGPNVPARYAGRKQPIHPSPKLIP